MLQKTPFSSCWLLLPYQQVQLVMLDKNVWTVSLDFRFYMNSSTSKYVTVVRYMFLMFHAH